MVTTFPCAACGYVNGPNRRSCKKCRVPLSGDQGQPDTIGQLSPEALAAFVDGHQQWQYTSIERNTTNMSMLVDDLNQLGLQGWEVVGFASSDKTVGFNSLFALLKRPRPKEFPEEG